MTKDIRTPKGKLVGIVDASTNTLYIKDGKKITTIDIPTNGLKLKFTVGDGVTEEVYISPEANTQQTA